MQQQLNTVVYLIFPIDLLSIKTFTYGRSVGLRQIFKFLNAM